jgi:hypothetical protein
MHVDGGGVRACSRFVSRRRLCAGASAAHLSTDTLPTRAVHGPCAMRCGAHATRCAPRSRECGVRTSYTPSAACAASRIRPPRPGICDSDRDSDVTRMRAGLKGSGSTTSRTASASQVPCTQQGHAHIPTDPSSAARLRRLRCARTGGHATCVSGGLHRKGRTRVPSTRIPSRARRRGPATPGDGLRRGAQRGGVLPALQAGRRVRRRRPLQQAPAQRRPTRCLPHTGEERTHKRARARGVPCCARVPLHARVPCRARVPRCAGVPLHARVSRCARVRRGRRAVFANGSVYEGEYHTGSFHGVGKLVESNGAGGSSRLTSNGGVEGGVKSQSVIGEGV